MKIIATSSILFFLLLTNIFLAPLLSAQTTEQADARVREAFIRLEEAVSGIADSARITRGGVEPVWINDPYAVYNRTQYFAAIGFAPSRDQAETRALSGLVSIFGQSIRSDFTVTTLYTEAVEKGVVSVSDNTSVRDIITTSASMTNLIGAQIGYVWDSGRGTFYAAAYLDKTRAVSLYTDMIIVNMNNINLLTTMSNTEKYTFDGLSRYRVASQIAGINENYAVIVRQCGGSVASLNLNNADFYNLEAANIISNITVAVSVNNDRANRLQNAFASALGAQGLRTRGNNPPYMLEVSVFASEAIYPNNSFKWCVIEISANLIENFSGVSLLPFSLNLREGHLNYENAETRAFQMAEREIAEKFPAALREYLAEMNF